MVLEGRRKKVLRGGHGGKDHQEDLKWPIRENTDITLELGKQ